MTVFFQDAFKLHKNLMLKHFFLILLLLSFELDVIKCEKLKGFNNVDLLAKGVNIIGKAKTNIKPTYHVVNGATLIQTGKNE